MHVVRWPEPGKLPVSHGRVAGIRDIRGVDIVVSKVLKPLTNIFTGDIYPFKFFLLQDLRCS